MHKKMSIKQYIDRIDLHIRKINDIAAPFCNSIAVKLSEDSEQNATYAAVINLFVKLDEIRHAILETLKIKSLYSAKILYRSFIEHYVKIQFFLCEYLENKNTSIGDLYYEYCDANELHNYTKSLRYIFNLIEMKAGEKNYSDIANELDSEFQKYSVDEIHKNSKVFTYKNMIKQIVYSFSKKSDKECCRLFGFIIEDYCLLSSCVHGGPLSDNEIFHSKRDFEEEVLHITDMTSELLIQCLKHNMFLLCELNPDAYIYQQIINSEHNKLRTLQKKNKLIYLYQRKVVKIKKNFKI